MNQSTSTASVLLAIIAASVIGGLFIGIGTGPYVLSSISHLRSSQGEAPHYVPSDNAIARFGLAPVNPDWLQVTHKSGQPIDGVPSHEWAVFTFLYEPHVERIVTPDTDRVTWKVTFEP